VFGDAVGIPGGAREDFAGLPALTSATVREAVLASLPDTSVFVFGPDLRYRFAAGAGLRSLGYQAEDLIGRRPSEVFGSDSGVTAELEEAMRAALAGESGEHEVSSVTRDDFHLVSTVKPLADAEGRIVAGLIVSRNIGALRQERRLRERLEFLTEIDRVLAGCRDRREVMRAVTAAAVPRLGDWCSVHVFLDPHDPLPTVEVAHADPAKVRLAEELLESIPYDPDAGVGIPQVIRTGVPVLFTPSERQRLEAVAEKGPIRPDQSRGLETIRRLALGSSLVVPLSVGGRVIGALTFSEGEGHRVLDADDLALADALAGRVGAALENRRIAEVERRIADTLQRSLLPPELPVIPGAEVAVRYWAAGEGTQVGGDFYDVFDTGHGAHAVVIGDVCGSGPAAAAVTATARYTIRALARHGDDHAAVLHHLDDAVRTGWPDIFCTVLYATLVMSTGGLQVTAVSGGHPLPILARAGETTCTALGEHGMLLGTVVIPEPLPFEVDLAPGDTLVFYTDGAYDLPPPRFLSDEDMFDLVGQAAAEATARGSGAEGVADGIARRLEAHSPFEDRDDDVAVVVIRATEP
jgi:serine phosphatase RsbU (regulator of sigma subunit)